MANQDPRSNSSGPSRPLFQRLRPFLRRELRARVASAVLAATAIGGLTWLGTSALTRMDSLAAQEVRVSLGLEQQWEVCDGPQMPRCNYDDREQAAVDREFAAQQRVRVAVLHELRGRVEQGLRNLDQAEKILKTEAVDLRGDLLGGRRDLHELLLTTIDLRPLTTRDEDLARTSALQAAAFAFDLEDGKIVADAGPLLRELDAQRDKLGAQLRRIDRLERRDGAFAIDTNGADRQGLWADLFNSDPYGDGGQLAGWVLSSGGVPHVSNTLSNLALGDTRTLADAIFNPSAPVWQNGLTDPLAEFTAIQKPSVRYRSPVDDGERGRLLGSLLFAFSAFMLLLVGPVVTATHTAREREAGTLPVLRMTGLSASDLALAMSVGPNVFAMVAGGLLLLPALALLGLTVGFGPLLVPLALLAVLTGATHLTAIGLGDALGQRVNALLVGALMAVGIAGAGLFGTAMVGANMASAGLLLGPLPAVLSEVLPLTGLPTAPAGELDGTFLGYAIGTQLLLAAICLLSWRRRVEQPWTPLFRPAEGVALALASVGCSGLTLLDLSARSNTQTFDNLNLLTFVACGFLLPLFGWLLVASLRRPARANAVPTHVEARGAFLRFQGVLAAAMVVVGFAYSAVMQRTGLAGEQSEVMWATLTQVLLIAETAVAALLLVSRRRDGKLGTIITGGALLLLQIAFAVAVYRLEVDHVAVTHTAGLPFLYGMNASPYWIALMILVWGAGFGLILTALLRERDQARAAAAEADEAGDEDGDDGRRGRWLH